VDFHIDLKRGSGDTLAVTTYCARELMEEFLKAHGIDVNRVPLPGKISVAFDQVTFEQFVLDSTGKPTVEDGDFKVELVTVPQRASWPLDTTA